MTTDAFKIVVGCIVPTAFDADVEGYGHSQCFIKDAGALQQAVRRQCKLWRREVEDRTGGKMNIRCRFLAPNTVVKRIRKQRSKGQQHEIADPDPSEWTTTDALRDAIAFFIWLPFETRVYEDLCRAQRKAHMNRKTHYVWLPCHEQTEIGRSTLRKGFLHELKEWLQHSAAKGTKVRMPKAHGADDFYAQVRDSMTADDLKCLRHKYRQDKAAGESGSDCGGK